VIQVELDDCGYHGNVACILEAVLERLAFRNISGMISFRSAYELGLACRTPGGMSGSLVSKRLPALTRQPVRDRMQNCST
jgi:hypothetical protein